MVRLATCHICNWHCYW